jgi:hypothetical protein
MKEKNYLLFLLKTIVLNVSRANIVAIDAIFVSSGVGVLSGGGSSAKSTVYSVIYQQCLLQ